jgi:branched-chain amino acid transport system permease protein
VNARRLPALVFMGLAALPFVMTAHWLMNMAVFTLMYAALATAWNLVGGYSGYPSLGHAAFFGVGAYSLALTFEHVGVGHGYTPFLVLPVIGVTVAVVSVPVAWIAMRTRATTFAIVTVTLLFVVQTLAFNLKSVTHGAQGAGMPTPPFSAATFERPFFYGMLGLFAVALTVCALVRRANLGLALLAIRGDEGKAAGVGVRTTAVKLAAFAVSVGITAMIGGVWAYYVSFIYPQFAVDPLVTIGMVLMVYLGGRGTLWGPALGAAIVVPAQQYLAYRLGANQFYLVGYAGLFLAIMLALPRGIIPSLSDRLTARRHRTANSADALVGTEAVLARQVAS